MPWTLLPASGVQEVFWTLTTAIGSARRYLYIEDQYFEEKPGGVASFELYPYVRAAAARGVKVVFVGSGTRDPADHSPGAINATLNSDLRTKIVDPLPPAAQRNFVLYRVERLTVHSKLVLTSLRASHPPRRYSRSWVPPERI